MGDYSKHHNSQDQRHHNDPRARRGFLSFFFFKKGKATNVCFWRLKFDFFSSLFPMLNSWCDSSPKHHHKLLTFFFSIRLIPPHHTPASSVKKMILRPLASHQASQQKTQRAFLWHSLKALGLCNGCSGGQSFSCLFSLARRPPNSGFFQQARLKTNLGPMDQQQIPSVFHCYLQVKLTHQVVCISLVSFL